MYPTDLPAQSRQPISLSNKLGTESEAAHQESDCYIAFSILFSILDIHGQRAASFEMDSQDCRVLDYDLQRPIRNSGFQ